MPTERARGSEAANFGAMEGYEARACRGLQDVSVLQVQREIYTATLSFRLSVRQEDGREGEITKRNCHPSEAERRDGRVDDMTSRCRRRRRNPRGAEEADVTHAAREDKLASEDGGSI